MAARPKTYRVQALDRVMAILDALEGSGRQTSLGDLAERVGLHKSTVYRLAAVLEAHGMVMKDRGTGNYALGLRLFELGSRAVEQLDLCERARGHLETLAAKTGEASHLCKLYEGEVLFLAKVDADHTIRVSSSVGGRKPAHCTAAGKALLAHLDAADLTEFVRTRGLAGYTERTVTTYGRLNRELKLVRARGYAISDEELETGVRSVGAAVYDYSDGVVAAISVAGPAFRVTDARLPEIAGSVVDAARALSADLGHPDTERRRSSS